MSLRTLFDTTVRVWRRTKVTGSLGEETGKWVPVGLYPEDHNACVNRPKAPLVPDGPGVSAVGTRRVYMAPEDDVQERDVLQFVDGPDAGGTYEVDNPPTRPRGHHMQLDTRVWHGQLPLEGS